VHGCQPGEGSQQGKPEQPEFGSKLQDEVVGILVAGDVRPREGGDLEACGSDADQWMLQERGPRESVEVAALRN
jgi:hypothetical protein